MSGNGIDLSSEAPTASADIADEISRDELLRRLGDPTLTIVDVLPRASFEGGHIPGALSLPVADLPMRARDVLPDPTAEIVVYCGSFTCPLAEKAVGLLHDLGYSHVRHYRGGIADWTESGAPVERGTSAPLPRRSLSVPISRREQWGSTLVAALEGQSTSGLFAFWLAMVATCGVLYWLAGMTPGHGLAAGGVAVGPGLDGFATALYFSFVTATSVGYGDVVPLGAVRILAIAEAVTGLLVFGAVVAKFVSRRQDELVREIHRVTFAERLDRVQTNFHLVLSELQAIGASCVEGGGRADRAGVRLESVALVFASELRAVHDLLYRPKWMPEEQILESILASLAASLRELVEVLTCVPTGFSRSVALQATLGTLARLTEDICGDCVPHAYTPGLRTLMDRVRETARRLG